MILALDLAFTHTGWAVYDPGQDRFVGFGCVRTRKASGKVSARLRVADDDFRRCRELSSAIAGLLGRFVFSGILAEIPHGGALASRASRTMGMATGVLASVVESSGYPVEIYSPDEVKEGATGRRNASKKAVKDSVLRRWPAIVEPLERFGKGDREHIFDAIGVVMAARRGLILSVGRVRDELS